MERFPRVSHAPLRFRDRLRHRHVNSYIAISKDIYLLRTKASPANFLDFRTAPRFELWPGQVTVTFEEEKDKPAIRVQRVVPGARPETLLLFCESSTDATSLILHIQRASATLSSLRDELFLFRRQRANDGHLRKWLSSLTSSSTSVDDSGADRTPLISHLTSFSQAIKGTAHVFGASASWAEAISSAVAGTHDVVDVLTRVLGTLPIAAPIIYTVGFAVDVAVLEVERSARFAEMRQLAPQCSSISNDVIAALFFSLDYAYTEDAVVDKLFVILQKLYDTAASAERYVMKGRASQIFNVEDVSLLSAEVKALETEVTSLRILQYVQENHLRNQRLDAIENDIFRRSFDVLPVPVSSGLFFEDVETPEAQVREMLFDENRKSGLVGILGMSGMGKSVILRGIANDARVRRFFDGGIYEIEGGNKCSEAEFVSQMARAVASSGGMFLSKKIESMSSKEEAVRATRDWFRGHRCLFLWDGIVSPKHTGFCFLTELRVLLDLSCGARALICTREADIFRHVANRHDIFRITAREPGLSRRIFFHCAELGSLETTIAQRCHANLPQAFHELISFCEGVPVSLSSAGSKVSLLMANNGISLHEACEKLVASENPLERLNISNLAKSSRESYVGLSRTLDLELEEDIDSEFFRRRGLSAMPLPELMASFCVLHPATWVPSSIFRKAWQYSDPVTSDLLRFLEGLCLCELRMVDEQLHVFVNSLMYQYCIQKATRGSNKQLTFWHSRVLDGYQFGDAMQLSQWWKCSAAQDKYIRQHLPRHFLYSELVNELLDILCDFQWVCGSTGRAQGDDFYARLIVVEETYRYLRSAVDAGHHAFLDEVKRKTIEYSASELSVIAQSIRLSMSSIRGSSELCFQLQARLHPYKNCNTIKSFLESMRSFHGTSSVLRARTASLISPTSRQVQSLDLEEPGMMAKAVPGKNMVVVAKRSSIVLVDLVRNAVVSVLPVPQGFSGTIVSMAISRRGDKVASGWEAGHICLWNLNGVSKPVVLQIPTSKHIHIDFMVDTESIVYGAGNGNVGLIDVGSGIARKFEFSENKRYVKSLAVNPKGDQVAVCHGNSSIMLYSTTEQKTPVELSNRQHEVNTVSWTADGRFVLSGGPNNEVVLHNPLLPGENSILGKHRNFVLSAASSPNGQFVVSGSHDHIVSIWDVETRELVDEPFHGHSESVSSVTYCDTFDCVCSVSVDGTLRAWSLSSHDNRRETWRHSRGVNIIACNRQMSMLASGSHDGSLKFWDMNNCVEITETHPVQGKRAVTSVCFSSNGSIVAVGFKDGFVWIIDMKNKEEKTIRSHCHDSAVSLTLFSPDGKYVVTGSQATHNNLAVWDIFGEVMQQQAMLNGHRNWVNSAVFSSTGALLVTGSMDKTLRVWDTGIWKSIGEPVKIPNTPRVIQLSDDNARLEVCFHADLSWTFEFSSGQIREILSKERGLRQKIAGQFQVPILVRGKKRITDPNTRQRIGILDYPISTYTIIDRDRKRVWAGDEGGLVVCLEFAV